MASTKIYDLAEIIGNNNINRISICGMKPMNMNDAELEKLIELTSIIKKRKEKKKIFIDEGALNQLKGILKDENLNSIDICGLNPLRMDREEILSLCSLIEVMKLRSKGYRIVNDRWELDGESINLTFDYHPTVVKMVSELPSSKWNPDNKVWLVHISDWPDVEKIFQVTQPNIELKYQEWKRHNAVNRLTITDKGCILTGLNLPFHEIHMATSFPDPNARHMPSYQNGNWDGRIALYDRYTGFFPYGLLPRVLKVLKDNNVIYEFKDERIKPYKKHKWQKNVRLRDYQQYTLEQAVKHGRGILQLATGAGKTKTASAIISEYGLNTIFFVHTHFLLEQATKELEAVLNTKIGQVGAGVVDIQPVTVAMVQTTIKALGGEYEPSIDDKESDLSQVEDDTDITGKEQLIIEMLNNAENIFFDECQFVAADTFYTIANYCPAYHKFGLSATPYRSDKKDLMIEAALGPIIHKINASYLIKRGFLTQPKIHFFKVGKMKPFDDRRYQTVYREDIIENYQRNKLIVESTKRLNSKNRSVLILVQQVNHGNILKEMFKAEGIHVEFVYGEDNLEKRSEEVFKLRTKKTLALIASTIADEGLDIPSLDAVILAGGGKSPCKSMQRIGRAIRVFGIKEQCFEIYTSLLELSCEGKNAIIIVDDIKDGEEIQKFLRIEDKSMNKVKFEVPLVTGENYKKYKKTLLENLRNKKTPFVIVSSKDITSDEINKLDFINTVIIHGGNEIDVQGINKTPANVKFYTKEEDLRFVVENCKRNLNSNKSILLLVEEPKHGRAIKSLLDKNKIKSRFLTGTKATENLEKIINDINTKKNKDVYIINSNYINKQLDLHLIDDILVIGINDTPYKTIEKLKRDVRLFTIKEEAFIVDFLDNSKYLYNHSIERKLMYQTEPEFVISGWK